MKNYQYTLILRKELNLTKEFTDALGQYLVNQMNKTSGINVKCLVIEKENEAEQPHLHIQFKSNIPRIPLIERLDHIKKYTPASLKTRNVIDRAFPIFTKYRGEMACKYFRDRENCPGKSNCKMLNQYGTLLCNSNTNLKEVIYPEHLDNLKGYLAKKKGNDNTLYYYEAR